MKQHIVAIDLIRGLCAINIVMIHTTFWSGGAYVPNAVQSLSLLIDVGAFFFIAGASVAASGRINPLATIYKMLFYFGICVFVYDLVAILATFRGGFHNTLAAITLQGFSTPSFAIFGGSYWFVPVFCVVAILCGLVLQYLRGILHFVAIGFLLVYALAYAFDFEIKGQFLGVQMSYILFYAGLYLLGFWFIWRKLSAVKLAIMLASIGGFGFLALALFGKNADIFTLQTYKFAPQLPYVLATLFGLGVLLLFYKAFGVAYERERERERNSPHGKCGTLVLLVGKGLEFAGINAIYFYIAQGFSSSLVLHIAPKISMWWGIKLALCFCINLALCVVFVCVLKLFFEKTFLAKFSKGKSSTN